MFRARVLSRPWLVQARLDLLFTQVVATATTFVPELLPAAPVLGNCSMRRLKAPTVGALPPASLQSCASIRDTDAIYGLAGNSAAPRPKIRARAAPGRHSCPAPEARALPIFNTRNRL